MLEPHLSKLNWDERARLHTALTVLKIGEGWLIDRMLLFGRVHGTDAKTPEALVALVFRKAYGAEPSVAVHPGQRYLHVKTGRAVHVTRKLTMQCSAHRDIDGEPAVEYIEKESLTWYVRPMAEFLDGRFTLLEDHHG